jgi:hypothetical protein
VKSAMEELTVGLFDWENPDLPDDPHFLRADGSVWLGSIIHERDAWLELTGEEFVALGQQAPSVVRILRADS